MDLPNGSSGRKGRKQSRQGGYICFRNKYARVQANFDSFAIQGFKPTTQPTKQQDMCPPTCLPAHIQLLLEDSHMLGRATLVTCMHVGRRECARVWFVNHHPSCAVQYNTINITGQKPPGFITRIQYPTVRVCSSPPRSLLPPPRVPRGSRVSERKIPFEHMTLQYPSWPH